MPYIVTNRDERVLSRETPYALLSWLESGVSRCTDYRYAIVFETFHGASKCARMQGGAVHSIGAETGAAATVVDFRPGAVWRMGSYRRPSGVVEVE